MRISADIANKDYNVLARNCKVYLDNVFLKYCITADDELNEVIVYKTDNLGNFILSENQAIEIQTLKGKVKILYERINN